MNGAESMTFAIVFIAFAWVVVHGINKRIDDLDWRFQHLDKRIDGLNWRFEHLDKRIDDLRESINRRFEHLDKRVDDQVQYGPKKVS